MSVCMSQCRCDMFDIYGSVLDVCWLHVLCKYTCVSVYIFVSNFYKVPPHHSVILQFPYISFLSMSGFNALCCHFLQSLHGTYLNTRSKYKLAFQFCLAYSILNSLKLNPFDKSLISGNSNNTVLGSKNIKNCWNVLCIFSFIWLKYQSKSKTKVYFTIVLRVFQCLLLFE